MTLLKELQEKLGLSYLFISHDLDVVRWFCDEIAVMEEGKFVETGRTEDVIGHPKMEFTEKTGGKFYTGIKDTAWRESYSNERNFYAVF